MHFFPRTVAYQAMAVFLGSLSAAAIAKDSAPLLETIEVRSATGGVTLQALPTSATVLDGQRMREHQMQVNLSEGLSGVPGLQIKNRQNYAQDLQLSVRGYGARSTFGVRGVRLYVDGIPATMPDGQGSLGHIDIGSLERVEVLRGPYSALYGNSAGGIVSMFTETPEGAPFVEGGVHFASNGQKRYAAKAGGRTEQGMSYLLSASRFTTDGYRDHSAADRNVANAKISTQMADGARVTLTANTMQSDAQDPQGLTWADYQKNPRTVSANTLTYNTRKSLEQTQLGATYERPLNAVHSVAVTAYVGQRSMQQFQSIPAVTQNINTNPGHAGGVIDMSRDYAGVDVRWSGNFRDATVPVTVTAGLALDYVQEDRQGYENFTGAATRPTQLGVKGQLRRDETNTITNTDPYIQASWQLAQRWSLDTGLRYSRVKFKVDDDYVQGSANPDDSGSAQHRKWLPVVALSHQLSRHDTVYASIGRGFETPTLAEMSYTPSGSGMNTGLRPSVSTQYEVGYRQRLVGAIKGTWSAAAFYAKTADEIVSDQNTGGRNTFKNAGETRRYGAELQADLQLSRQWDVQAAYTYLNAQFREGANAGRMLPGLSKQSAYVGVNYRPTAAWRLGVSAQHSSQVFVNDKNIGAAPAFTIASAHVGYTRPVGAWTLQAFARVDNLFDRQYVGSVIVNDSNGATNPANGRYYEAAPGRNWSTGLSARYDF